MRLTRRTPGLHATTSVVGAPYPLPLMTTPALEERFRAFYERTYAKWRAYAGKFVSEVEAEDAVHDAMTDLWISWATKGPRDLPDRFFLAILRNKIRDQQRARHRLVSVEDVEQTLEIQVFRESTRPTRGDTPGDLLDLAMAALPPKRVEAFVLTQEHDFTYKEAGTVMRVSENTVKTHVRLALADLRDSFAKAKDRNDEGRNAGEPIP